MIKKKEAQARLKIDKLLERSGWRLIDFNGLKANVIVEPRINLIKPDESGKDYEKAPKGYIDYLLLDDKNYPLAVLEAKKESIDPLSAKEQARKYANSQNVRFIILSNGNISFLWDLEHGSPEVITELPTQKSLQDRINYIPNYNLINEEIVEKDYIVKTQMPDYHDNPEFLNKDTQKEFIQNNNLRFLRPYQVKAISALQKSACVGNSRFLFEMATGTGKTLVSAAAIKLFLRTGNAKRILFLVDRLELESQALRNFEQCLKKDYRSVIYKNNVDDWYTAEIVISTVQSLTFQNKYNELFSPTDFDLIISDEAHRSINGNSRALFEYFVGYKLGLTATPKDYLKNFNNKRGGVKSSKIQENGSADNYLILIKLSVVKIVSRHLVTL